MLMKENISAYFRHSYIYFHVEGNYSVKENILRSCDVVVSSLIFCVVINQR